MNGRVASQIGEWIVGYAGKQVMLTDKSRTVPPDITALTNPSFDLKYSPGQNLLFQR